MDYNSKIIGYIYFMWNAGISVHWDKMQSIFVHCRNLYKKVNIIAFISILLLFAKILYIVKLSKMHIILK